jgi:hypothetical protein
MKKAPFWRRLVENLNSRSIAQDEGFVKGMKEVRIGMAGGVGFKRRNPRNDRGNRVVVWVRMVVWYGVAVRWRKWRSYRGMIAPFARGGLTGQQNGHSEGYEVRRHR